MRDRFPFSRLSQIVSLPRTPGYGFDSLKLSRNSDPTLHADNGALRYSKRAINVRLNKHLVPSQEDRSFLA